MTASRLGGLPATMATGKGNRTASSSIAECAARPVPSASAPCGIAGGTAGRRPRGMSGSRRDWPVGWPAPRTGSRRDAPPRVRSIGRLDRRLAGRRRSILSRTSPPSPFRALIAGLMRGAGAPRARGLAPSRGAALPGHPKTPLFRLGHSSLAKESISGALPDEKGPWPANLSCTTMSPSVTPWSSCGYSRCRGGPGGG